MLFELKFGTDGTTYSAMGSSIATTSGSSIIDARKLSEFKVLLGKLSAGMNIHFSTTGNWSLHDLVAYLLTLTGKADIYFSTWSIREEPVWSMIHWKQSEAVGSIQCLLDHRAPQRDHQTVMLCQDNFDRVAFAKCHAKVTVLVGEKMTIAINGSQNYTRNPRIECGVISTDESVCNFHLTWLKYEIDKQS